MKYNPEIHHRKSIRLKDYDYSKEGLYFITICTQNRENLFGEIINKNVGAGSSCPNIELTKIGEIIKNQYFELEKHFDNRCNYLTLIYNLLGENFSESCYHKIIEKIMVLEDNI